MFEGSGQLSVNGGNDVHVKRGVSLFVCAGSSLSLLSNNKGEGETLTVYRACVNDAFWR